MKTLTKRKMSLVLVMAFVLLAPLFKAQNAIVNCPFYIQNNRNCDVTVHIEVSDCNENACGGTGVGVFYNSLGTVIPAGGIIWLPSPGQCLINPAPGYPTGGTCGLGGDVYVWLKEIDYVDITGGGSNGFSVSGGNCFAAGFTGSGATAVGTILASYGVSPACMGSGTYTLVWNSGGVDIW